MLEPHPLGADPGDCSTGEESTFAAAVVGGGGGAFPCSPGTSIKI